MVTMLFKWFLLLGAVMPLSSFKVLLPEAHPIFMSVTEIEHNAKDKTLEINCKIFTDDFEKTLRKNYKGAVDLINPKDKPAMDKLISSYVQQHLLISVDGKTIALKYIGYEIIEEGVESYYEAANIGSIKKIEVMDNILYEYKTEQMGIIHAIVGGERKSIRLNNPDAKAVFQF
jgi:hypothetical protein